MKEVGTETENKKIIDTSLLSSNNDNNVSEEKELSVTTTLSVPFIKSKAEKKFIKKLNWTLLPLVWTILFLQVADKAAITSSAVLGIFKDTKINGSEFSFLGSIFFAGHLAFQIPNSYLIQRLRISKYLGSLAICWGATTIGTAFCHNFGQLAVCRVLLGLFEAPTYPCLLITLNSLYRRQEQSACVGFMWFSTSTGAIVSSFITYGIAKNLDGAYGITAWRWNYLILGIITIFIGILTFFFLVDNPHSKLLRLTEEEKKIVEDRIQDNAVVKDKKIKFHHYWEALREPRYYIVVIGSFFCFLPNTGVFLFITPLIASLGFSTLDAILLKIPNNIMMAVYVYLAVYIHRRSGKYSFSIIVCNMMAIVGFILLIVLPHTAIKLLGFYLSWGFIGSYSILTTIVANNVSGYSKKIFYNSSIMIAYTLANFVGPFVMLDNEAPTYRTGMITFLVAIILASLCILLSLYLMYRSNKKRLVTGVSKTDAYLDLTDQEDSNFIYKL